MLLVICFVSQHLYKSCHTGLRAWRNCVVWDRMLPICRSGASLLYEQKRPESSDQPMPTDQPCRIIEMRRYQSRCRPSWCDLVQDPATASQHGWTWQRLHSFSVIPCPSEGVLFFDGSKPSGAASESEVESEAEAH